MVRSLIVSAGQRSPTSPFRGRPGRRIDVKKAIAHQLANINVEKNFYQFGSLFDDVSRRADDAQYIRERFIDTAFRVQELMFVSDPPGKNSHMRLLGSNSRATKQLLSVVDKTQSSIIWRSFSVVPR